MNARFPRPAEAAPPVRLPRRSIPSIAGLIAFEATARHLSFSRAARDLALSQGAVSKRVRSLEDTLGVTLLFRTRQEVRLTDTGRRFLDEVRRMLAEFESTTQAYLAQDGEVAALAIGLPRSVATHWLMPRLPRLQAACPGLVVNLATITGRDDAEPPLDGVIRPVGTPPRGSVTLWEEELLAVAAPDLAARAAREGLASVTLLRHARHPDLWPRWSASHGAAAPSGGPAHDSLALLIEAALLGQGAALVPTVLAAPALAGGRLAALHPEAIPTGRRLAFIAPPGRSSSLHLARFAAWLAEEAEKGRAEGKGPTGMPGPPPCGSQTET